MVMVTTIGTVTMMKVMLIKQQPEAQLKAAYQTATSFCRTIRIRSTQHHDYVCGTGSERRHPFDLQPAGSVNSDAALRPNRNGSSQCGVEWHGFPRRQSGQRGLFVQAGSERFCRDEALGFDEVGSMKNSGVSGDLRV